MWEKERKRLMICNLCPRRCNAERDERRGEGFCRMGTLPVVARAAPHFWEEPCISGSRGSGAVFFSGCSLGCVFCQNGSISRHGAGKTLTPTQLSAVFQRLEERGVHNINLVTPGHFAPAVLEALSIRKPRVPVVWNSSGYETPETIESARGLVDVYLPDLKYFSGRNAAALADAPDYFPVALRAIQAMCAQTGPPRYDGDGLLLSGTLVRHLVLPLRVRESVAILDAVAAELPEGTPVSLMRQYTPMNESSLPGLNRRLTGREYRLAVEHMQELGIPGYLQEKESALAAYTPAFNDEESLRLLS